MSMRVSAVNTYGFKFNNIVQNKQYKNLSVKNIQIMPSCIYFGKSSSFNPKNFLDSIRYENAEKEYSNGIHPNKEGIEKLSKLQGLSLYEKKLFVDEFCKETGFPSCYAVKQNIEKEIINGITELSKEADFDVKFIGYDKNSSLGRNLALPGSDCDALFYIIDPKDNKEPWFAGMIRWNLKDRINQRILCTHAGGLPEVLTETYIEDGLKLADEALKKCGFTSSDYKRFMENINDDSNDFVKSAEFNIRLAKQVPKENDCKTQYYKTAMLCELIRSGVMLQNNLSSDLIEKIRKSPLYKYSNLMKQDGLSSKLKDKHIKRQSLYKDFKQMDTEEQFKLVTDLIKVSFMLPVEGTNEHYFANYGAMGNIVDMYTEILS